MHEKFLRQAIELALQNVEGGRGGPFGALIVKHGEIVSSGTNLVTSTNDPVAHAEVVAIRSACQRLGDFQLTGCVLYTSCEPCPMCLGAVYWARLERVFYAGSRRDAAAAGFDDSLIYEEINRPPQERLIPMEVLIPEEARRAFDAWRAKADRIEY